MGVTNPVVQAHDEIKLNLHYELDLAKADQFRRAIEYCGLERFRHCLKLVVLMGDAGPRGTRLDGPAKHQVLLALMRLCAPHKTPGTKYRNPQTAAGVAVHDQLDADFAERLAREP